jgi:hypothetical protein
MAGQRRVLLVTDDLGSADRWGSWLRGAGYSTLGCVGPGLTLDCPRIHGGSCVLREAADIAIVDLNCDEDADLCTKIPGDGGSVFVRRGSVSEPDRPGLMQGVADAQWHVDALKGGAVMTAAWDDA